jgi:thiol-disulfide isomerase/thioredoxin
LTLAGRGDIHRFLDRAEELRSRFEKTYDLRTEDQFRVWVAPLGAEAEKLGRLLDTGLFEVNSLFCKTLNTTLSRDQSDRLAAQPRGIDVPEIPSAGWIGGPAPDLKGKPYLIHFWATQSAACKTNLPALKNLVKEGASVIGIHPVPVPTDEIADFIRDEGISYPTLTGSNRVVGAFMNINGCRVKVLPYCIVVDRAGLVAGFGMLGPALLARFQELREESVIGSKD